MIGILIGTACLVGLMKVIRGSRHGCYGGYGGGFGRHGRHGFGGACGSGAGGFGPFGGDGRQAYDGEGGFRGGFFLRGLSSRLNLTPAQEKEVMKAFSDLREGGKAAKDALRGTRSDVAKAMRSESFDEVSLGTVIASIEDTTETLRKKGLDAFAKVHAVLDPSQREALADIIERGPRGFGGFGQGHPYRI
ncbi:MAG: periplasmic heavy metal sensor [Polyangiaceae bacterium]